MITANNDLRGYMRKHFVPYWKLALKIGVAESTLIRWLRTELPEHKKQEYMSMVDEIYTEEVLNR